MTTAAAYAALAGVSALVLTDRLWAWGIVSALVLSLLSLALFWYFPVVVPARMAAGAMDAVGWLEAIVYTGLLCVAAFVCALRLLGARPAPERG